MVRIIKAHTTPGAGIGEAFNFIDLEHQRDEIIASARREAEEIVDEARRDANAVSERLFAQARESGRDTGLQDSLREIARQADEIASQRMLVQLETALPALRMAAESLQAERDRWLIRWEQTAVRLGVAIAEKLLQRQLAARPEYATEMITNALQLAAGQPQLTVYLHPEDLAAWGDHGPKIVQSLTACADTTLVSDSQMMRGGCRIETRHGEIDARVESMLFRIAEELVDG